MGHAAPVIQVPVPSQVTGAVPLQYAAPGVQLPTQRLPTQAWLEQTVCVAQFPSAPQLSTALALQRVCPGAQLPLQLPEMQVWPTQAASSAQVPAPEQTCGA